MLTNFSCIIENNKPQATISNGPQGALTITVEVIITSLTPKGLLKTQLFEKKRKLSGEEKIWPIFSRIIACNKP